MTWREVTIRALCERTHAVDPRRNPEVAFRYIDISGIDRTAKCIATTAKILGADAPSRARQLVQTDDVLVSTVRPNLNSVAIVPEELDGEIASTGFCVLRARKKTLDPRYLFHFTRTDPFVGALLQHVRGANYPAVTDRNVVDVAIPLPPPSEQSRIVEILDQADALRKKRAEADAKAARILPALFYRTFGDPATNPKGWPVTPFGDLVEIGTRLVDPNQDEYLDLPHIGGEQIEGGTGRILDHKMVRESNLRSGKFTFTEKHVLYSKIRPYLNKVAFPRFSGVCSADIYPLLPKDKRVSPWYIVALLRTPAFLSYAAVHSERLRMPKLNQEQLSAFKCQLPNNDLLTTFERRAVAIDHTLGQLAAQSEKVTRLFSVLLHRAFTGDLTAKWREAHMKELLTEMEVQSKVLESHQSGPSEPKVRSPRGATRSVVHSGTRAVRRARGAK